MQDAKKMLKDPFIPVILLFSVITAIILSSKISLKGPDSRILGAYDPPLDNCKKNQCGFCKNCGGDKGPSCGQAARCIEKDNVYACNFDFRCVK